MSGERNNDKTESESIALFHDRRLEVLRQAYLAGTIPALYEAIQFCRGQDIKLPDWALNATLETIEKLFRGEFSNKLGRVGNPSAKYKEDLKHYTRWDTVAYVREYQKTTWAEHKELLASGNISSEERQRLEEYAPYDAGVSWVRAYEEAAKILEGSPSYGTPETIKRSYQLVKRAMVDPEQRGRFYLVSEKTRKILGVEN